MILICKQIRGSFHRLCQDRRWRDFANFGSYPSCVKTYRSLGHARRIAKQLGAKVVVVPKTMSVDAVGDVIEEADSPSRANYKIQKRRTLQEFIDTDGAVISDQTA